MNIELLAPAGSYDSLVAAMNAGADAVYIGGSKFGARAFANNLNEEQLLEAIDYVHLHGKKLYLTVNTLLKEEELKGGLYDYIKGPYDHGLDAVIVQDLGVLSFIRKHFPDLDIHASTQMTITGAYGAAFLEEQGVTRVVTSREASLAEISQIRDKTDLEIESFVHGALCYCYSGQCLYSSMIGGRSGNRGRCAQPCRLPYEVLKDGKKVSQKDQGYVLSPKDICTLEILPDLIEAGVTSLKIEGRMKKPEYTAGVVSIYRKYLDLYLKHGKEGYHVKEEDMVKLMDLYNRGGFSKGYYVQRNGRKMISLSRPNHFGTPVGRVFKITKDSILIEVTKVIHKGDVLELLKDSNGEKGEFISTKEYQTGETLKISLSGKYKPVKGQMVHRTRNETLLKELKSITEDKVKENIKGNLIFSKDLPVILEVTYGDIYVKAVGDIVTAAKNKPLTKEAVQKQINKTGNTPFAFESLDISMDDGLFIPIQALNALRRQALEELEERILSPFHRIEQRVEQHNDITSINLKNHKSTIPSQGNGSNHLPEINVYIENLSYVPILKDRKEITRIYINCTALSYPYGTKEEQRILKDLKECNKNLYFVFPHILRQDTLEVYNHHWKTFLSLPFDGVLVKNLEIVQLLSERKYHGDVIVDHNVYTFNHQAIDFWKDLHTIYDTVPLELNFKETKNRGCQNSEWIIYGYMPMMVSAQCVQNTVSGCTKKTGSLMIKDRKNISFCVKNYCDYCYNIIYNSEPLFLFDKEKEMSKLNPRSVRLHLTLETKAEAEVAITQAIDSFYYQRKVVPPLHKFTRGHYNRGIE